MTATGHFIRFVLLSSSFISNCKFPTVTKTKKIKKKKKAERQSQINVIANITWKFPPHLQRLTNTIQLYEKFTIIFWKGFLYYIRQLLAEVLKKSLLKNQTSQFITSWNMVSAVCGCPLPVNVDQQIFLQTFSHAQNKTTCNSPGSSWEKQEQNQFSSEFSPNSYASHFINCTWFNFVHKTPCKHRKVLCWSHTLQCH